MLCNVIFVSSQFSRDLQKKKSNKIETHKANEQNNALSIHIELVITL